MASGHMCADSQSDANRPEQGVCLYRQAGVGCRSELHRVIGGAESSSEAEALIEGQGPLDPVHLQPRMCMYACACMSVCWHVHGCVKFFFFVRRETSILLVAALVVLLRINTRHSKSPTDNRKWTPMVASNTPREETAHTRNSG